MSCVRKILCMFLVLLMLPAVRLTVTAQEDEAQKEVIIAAGSYHTVWVNSDGTVGHVGRNRPEYLQGLKDVVQIAAHHATFGLDSEGTLVFGDDSAWTSETYQEWFDLVDIDSSECDMIGLRSDGTVITTGKGDYNTYGWSNIVDVAAGMLAIYGLRENGTVIALGKNDQNQMDVEEWTDIKEITAGNYYAAGLKKDGTVVVAGGHKWYKMDTSTWTDIVAIRGGANHLVGLKSDGTVVATGNNEDGQCLVSAWADVVALDAGFCHTVAVTSDGTLLGVGSNSHGQVDFGGQSRS